MCIRDRDYYLLAENTPAGKEGETVLTLVNLYQEAEEGNSSSSSAAVSYTHLSANPSDAYRMRDKQQFCNRVSA